MVINIFTGDLFDAFTAGSFHAIAQGCNCQNTMGSGIAVQFRQRYPQCYDADTECFFEHVEENHRAMLGSFSKASTPHGWVYNLYTQFNPGKDADYNAIASAFKVMNKELHELFGYGYRLGLPFIGSGIGGLDINAVLTIADLMLVDGDVTFFMLPSDTSKFKISKQFQCSPPESPRYTFAESNGEYYRVCNDFDVESNPSKLPLESQDLSKLLLLPAGRYVNNVYTNKLKPCVDSVQIIPISYIFG